MVRRGVNWADSKIHRNGRASPSLSLLPEQAYTYSGIPVGGSTTERILSISFVFRMRSFTVVDVRDGEAFTCNVEEDM